MCIRDRDKSVYHYYSDFAEKGYYNRIIAGNINQVLTVDSVVCDLSLIHIYINPRGEETQGASPSATDTPTSVETNGHPLKPK